MSFREFLNELSPTYTVYKLNINNKRTHKEHLNNLDELNAWLYDKYGKYASVVIVNDKTGKETYMTDNGREYVKIKQVSESSKVKIGTKVYEHGHLVGKITKIVDNPTYGFIYHVVDADGDKWTFNTGHIKSFSGNRIDVIT